jgi:hypothetical protein
MSATNETMNARAEPKWDSPLFWIATACFGCAVGRPVLEGLVSATVSITTRLGNHDVAYGATWAVALGAPLSFFVMLLGSDRRWLRRLMTVFERRTWRMSLLIVAATVVITGRVFESGILNSAIRASLGASDSSWRALSACNEATLTLAIAGPIAFAALVFGLRAASGAATATSPGAQALWIGLGALLGIVTTVLGEFAWQAATILAGRAGFRPEGVRILVWIVTLATPLVTLAAFGAWLRHRVPLPAAVIGAPRFGLATTILCIVTVGSVVWVNSVPLDAYAASMYAPAREARALAGVLAGTFVPLVAGALMLRLRHLAWI